MIRILLVEDNAMVRGLVCDMMILQDDLHVVGTADNGTAALELFKEGLQADIVLADLNMQGMGGLELTKNVLDQHPNVKVIILTMHANIAYVKRVMAAGASGYLLKNGDMDELYSAIRRVNTGELFVGKDVPD